jgi:acyl-CoA dehydrogenase
LTVTTPDDQRNRRRRDDYDRPAIEALLRSFARIGKEVTGPAAADVDSSARFPTETIDALRDEGLLSLVVPTDLGGAGRSLPEVARAINLLAQHCSSTGLILAMHYSQLAVLARHGRNDALRDLQRRVVSDQLLLANCNSETQIRGDDRSSRCHLERRSDGSYLLDKETPVISYGSEADVLLITARRSASASENDQVVVACERTTLVLDPGPAWDMLGLRGTCSRSYRVRASGPLSMVLDDSYDVIVNETGMGATNILFAGFWLGVAEAAATVAHRSVRADRSGSQSARIASLRLAELVGDLQAVRDRTWSAAERFALKQGSPEAQTLEEITDLQGLKVLGTLAPVEIATQAMRICGVKSYLGGSPWSLGRILRDGHGLALMASADSALQQNSEMLTVRKSI